MRSSRAGPLVEWRVDLGPPGEQLAQPGHPQFVVVAPLAAFLVAPVGRDAELGMLVHAPCPDLDLERAPGVIADDRVQRLISIGLGSGDVVVVLALDRIPLRVHERKDLVALCDFVDDDAQATHVIDLLERQSLGCASCSRCCRCAWVAR